MQLSQINDAVETLLWRIGLRGPLPYYWVFIPLGAGILLILIAGLMMPFRQNADNYWSVCRLETNSAMPSRIYLELNRYGCYNNADSLTYQSSDFGESWMASSYRFTGESWQPSRTALPGLSVAGDVLYYYDQKVWGSSRQWFRAFFTASGYNTYSYSSEAQSAVSGDGMTVYVVLNQKQILAGPNPALGVSSEGWHILRYQGIPELVPQPLTITHPLIVLVIIGLALTVPPLPWLHSWLLGQVWSHVLPSDEQDTALHLGFLTAAEISVIAVFAIILWLGNIQIDFYHIVGFMTLVTVGISLSQASNLSQRLELEPSTRWRLLLATGLVSLIVPIGVATTPVAFGFGWAVIITLICGFMIYRRILTNYRNYMMINMSHWQIDRVALEMVGLAAVAVVTFTMFFVAIGPQLGGWGLLGVPLLSITTVGIYSTGRGQSFMTSRKSDQSGWYLLFNSAEWRGSLFWNSLYWIAGSAFMSAVIVGVQAGVYAWFITLGQY